MRGKTSLMASLLITLGVMSSVAYAFIYHTQTLDTTQTIIDLRDAFISYRANTGSNPLDSPKERTWDGVSWSSEGEMPDAGGQIRFVRVAYSPLSARHYEKVVATLSDDQYIDVFVWNGTNWLATYNVGAAGSKDYRCFDVAYERTSGEALLVYSKGGGQDILGYRIWDGTSWSEESTIELSTINSVVYWLILEQKPTGSSNEIAMMALDKEKDVYGAIWNGSQFENIQTLTIDAPQESTECVAVAYESTSGYATFVWADKDKYAYSRQWSGSSWDPASTQIDLNGVTAVDMWFSLKSDPSSDNLMLLDVDGANDLNTAYWDGSSWSVTADHDAAVDTKASRCADFAWEPSGSGGLMVWGTDSDQLSYKVWNGTSWSQTNTISAAGKHNWIQLRTSPINNGSKILGAVLNDSKDLGGLSWNGATLTNLGDDLFTSDTATTTYECFEIQFKKH